MDEAAVLLCRGPCVNPEAPVQNFQRAQQGALSAAAVFSSSKGAPVVHKDIRRSTLACPHEPCRQFFVWSQRRPVDSQDCELPIRLSAGCLIAVTLTSVRPGKAESISSYLRVRQMRPPAPQVQPLLEQTLARHSPDRADPIWAAQPATRSLRVRAQSTRSICS